MVDAEDLQGPFSTFHAIDKNNSGIFNVSWLARGFTAAGTVMMAITWAGSSLVEHGRVLPEKHFVSIFSSST